MGNSHNKSNLRKSQSVPDTQKLSPDSPVYDKQKSVSQLRLNHVGDKTSKPAKGGKKNKHQHADDIPQLSPTEAAFLPEFPLRGDLEELDFDIITVIARGAYGNVIKVQREDVKQFYAVKVLDKHQILEEGAIRQCKDEATIQSMAGEHPLVVKAHEYWQSRKSLYIVLDYIPYGDMFTLWTFHGAFPEDLVRLYIAEMALVIDFLHNASVIYRDVKMENILFNAMGHIQLTDFGLAKWLQGGDMTRTVCGTLQYMAPEVLSVYPYNHSADWWSLGILMYAMLAGRYPVDGADTHTNMAQKVFESDFLLPSHISNAAQDVINRVLTKSPHKRLCDVNSLQDLDFFQGIFFSHLLEQKLNPIDVVPEDFFPMTGQSWAPHLLTDEDQSEFDQFDDTNQRVDEDHGGFQPHYLRQSLTHHHSEPVHRFQPTHFHRSEESSHDSHQQLPPQPTSLESHNQFHQPASQIPQDNRRSLHEFQRASSSSPSQDGNHGKLSDLHSSNYPARQAAGGQPSEKPQFIPDTAGYVQRRKQEVNSNNNVISNADPTLNYSHFNRHSFGEESLGSNSRRATDIPPKNTNYQVSAPARNSNRLSAGPEFKTVEALPTVTLRTPSVVNSTHRYSHMEQNSPHLYETNATATTTVTYGQPASMILNQPNSSSQESHARESFPPQENTSPSQDFVDSRNTRPSYSTFEAAPTLTLPLPPAQAASRFGFNAAPDTNQNNAQVPIGQVLRPSQGAGFFPNKANVQKLDQSSITFPGQPQSNLSKQAPGISFNAQHQTNTLQPTAPITLSSQLQKNTQQAPAATFIGQPLKSAAHQAPLVPAKPVPTPRPAVLPKPSVPVRPIPAPRRSLRRPNPHHPPVRPNLTNQNSDQLAFSRANPPDFSSGQGHQTIQYSSHTNSAGQEWSNHPLQSVELGQERGDLFRTQSGSSSNQSNGSSHPELDTTPHNFKWKLPAGTTPSFI